MRGIACTLALKTGDHLAMRFALADGDGHPGVARGVLGFADRGRDEFLDGLWRVAGGRTGVECSLEPGEDA